MYSQVHVQWCIHDLSILLDYPELKWTSDKLTLHSMPGFGLAASFVGQPFLKQFYINSLYMIYRYSVLNSYITAVDELSWIYCNFYKLQCAHSNTCDCILHITADSYFYDQPLVFVFFFIPERNSSLHYCTQKNSCTSKSIWKSKNLLS